MGRGDKKSKKGKIAKGSYGNTRNRKSIKKKINGTGKAEGAEAATKTARKKA